MANSIKILKDIHSAFEKIKKEERWAVADALTEVGKQAVEALEKEVQRVFDRPTKWVIKSFYSTRANERNIRIKVGIKDFAGKSKNTASVILGPHIEGGNRSIKRMEFWLREKGMLKTGEYVVPGIGIKLNKNGNISGPQITKILSGVKAFSEVGYKMNVTEQSKKRKRNPAEYFVIRSGIKSHLHPGIYQRTSSSVKPLLMFVRTPVYKKVFNFEKIITDVYNKSFPKEVRDQIAKRLT